MLDQEMEMVLQQRKAAEVLAKVRKIIIVTLLHVIFWLPLMIYNAFNYTLTQYV